MCTLCTSLDLVLAAEAAGRPTADPTGSAGFAAAREAVSSANLTEGTDAAAGTGTNYTLSVGEIFEGSIATGSDSDWVAVSLVGGENYVFSAWGTGGSGDGIDDTVLTVYNAAGQEVAFNDDVAFQFGNYFSVVEFTAPSTGTYFLEVEGLPIFDEFEQEIDPPTGDYLLQAASEFYTIEQAASYIIEIDWGAPAPIYFNTDTISVNLDALTADGRQLARWALEAWEDALGVTFQETGDPHPGILFDDNQSGAFAGPANYNPNTGVTSPDPSSGRPGATVNVSTDWLADYGTTIDSYSYQTYLHEIGHALGLGHAGPYDGNATFADAIHANDSTLWSVMSYFDPDDNPNVAGAEPVILTPMLADLVAVHGVYGRPTANDGDTVWGAGSNVDGWLGTLFGMMFDGDTRDAAFYDGGPVSFTIFDTGGTDTANLSTVTDDQRIDLRGGAISDVGGVEGGMLIDVRTVVENAIGGSGDDTITGNAADNRLTGRGGDDVIDGMGGTDTAVIDVARNSVTVTQQGSAIVIASASGTDRYSNVELFEFSNGTVTAEQLLDGGGSGTGGPTEGADTLTGSDGADSIDALGGDDVVSGGAGADALTGGAGNDSLMGEGGPDTLTGSNGADTLEGGAGNDSLSGGGGADVAVFAVARATVTVTDLGGGSVTIAADGLGTDTLSGVERVRFTDGTVDLDTLLEGDGGGNTGGTEPQNLVGGPGADTLTGGDGDDSLFGQDGGDVLSGGAGNDLIAGSAGDDVIDGGLDDDEIGGGLGGDTIDGGAGNDTIGAGQGDDSALGGAGNDIVNGGAGNDSLQGQGGNDTMGAGFNNDDVSGGDGDDSLGGGTGRDTLDGGGGDDTIGGGEGDDTVLGGSGDDFLAGGGRADRIEGGSGDDRINGGGGDDFMVGGTGADLFIFNALVDGETDVILDFETGLDRIRLTGVEGAGNQGKFAALEITEGLFGVVVTYNGHQIEVDGLAVGALDAGDFVFL